MTDMHDDYLDHATTRLRAAVTAAGDEHDLWVAEVSKRARRYRLAAKSAHERWSCEGVVHDAKAEAMEALLRWAES